MTTTTQPHTQTASGTSQTPTESLCFLQYEGYHLKEPQTYRQLVNEPHAICDRCGRTAHNRINICDPYPLT